jgi:predicted dehydrogenase
MSIIDEMKRGMEAAVVPEFPKRTDFAIGCAGAGGIMRNSHLPAYRKAGFNPTAICSRDRARREEIAGAFDIPKTFNSWEELIEDPGIEILDIAMPPDVQLEIIKAAIKRKHIKGILCQKPLAMSLEGAREIAELGRKAGIPIGVNQNMRWDQSIKTTFAYANAVFYPQSNRLCG